MKFSLKFTTLFIFIIVFGTISGNVVSHSSWVQSQFFSTVSAEDDEEEEEEEEEDDDDEQYTSESNAPATTVKMKQVVQDVIEYRSVTKSVVVTSEEYTRDLDGDALVDAIDPNPTIKQSEFFTDIDGDGVANAFDQHHDEDDFAFFDDSETDSNNNGILDSYEQ